LDVVRSLLLLFVLHDFFASVLCDHDRSVRATRMFMKSFIRAPPFVNFFVYFSIVYRKPLLSDSTFFLISIDYFDSLWTFTRTATFPFLVQSSGILLLVWPPAPLRPRFYPSSGATSTFNNVRYLISLAFLSPYNVFFNSRCFV